MNGFKANETPFDDIRLSLDPATLDAALGKRKVRAIDPDGSLVYDDETTANDKLTEQLERIWNEYPNGLLDISEAQLERLKPDEDAIKKEDGISEESKERDPFKMMGRNEMEQSRSEVHESLNAARNELWFVLELAKTLAVSSSFTHQPPPVSNQVTETATKKGKGKPPQKPNEADNKASLPGSVPQEPPILPPGTFSTTPSSQPTKPTHTQVHELELVLAAKQQALDECSALIDSAVSELQMMATAGNRFWKDVRQLKEGDRGRGQWAVIPRPDFGRTMMDGEKAKDIIIPYAIDEAPRAARSRCLAAFDLDPTIEDALTFGSRSYLRLKVTLKDISGAVIGSSPVVDANGSDVRAKMEAAQMEAFDEDLFGQIRYEASLIPKSELEPRTVSLPVAEYTLAFELYDTRISSQTPTSPLCDLVVSSARLNLINLHRQRKAKLVTPISSDSSLITILEPIIHSLKYRQLCNTVDSTLRYFSKLLDTAGIHAVSSYRMVTSGSELDAISDFLTGKSDVRVLSGHYELDISACHGIKIDTSAPFSLTVILSNASFELSNPDELSHILSEELASQLTHLIYSKIQNQSFLSSNASIRSKIFLDELEEVIYLGSLGHLRISIPPPFHTLLCNVDPSPNEKSSITGTVQGYDARRDGNIQNWIERMVEALVALP